MLASSRASAVFLANQVPERLLMSKYMSAQEDLHWHVSRTCDNGQCIRVARKGESILIGNTNSPDGPVSEFTMDEWRQFLAGAKLGDFDGIA
jgi:hypothetical protein